MIGAADTLWKAAPNGSDRSELPCIDGHGVAELPVNRPRQPATPWRANLDWLLGENGGVKPAVFRRASVFISGGLWRLPRFLQVVLKATLLAEDRAPGNDGIRGVLSDRRLGRFWTVFV